jgi:hypothetical protein
MEKEVTFISEVSYSPPPQLTEMFWWGLASILIISVGISVALSIIKEIVRSFRKLPNKVEKLGLRLLGILLGVLILSFAQFYPFNLMPITITILLGMITGAHSELVYRWFLKALESWLKKKFTNQEDNQ